MSPAAVARRVAGKGAKLPRRRPVPHDRSEPILGGTAPKLPVSAATEPLALFPPVAARMDVADAVPAPALNAGSRTGAVEAEAVAAPPVALGPSAEAAPVETPPVAFAGAAMVPPASDRSRGRLSLSVVASLLIHGGVLAFALYLGVKVADMPATGEDAVAVEIVAGEPAAAAVADTASGAEAAASENAASETQPVEMPVEEPPPQQVAEPPPPVVEPPPPQLTEAPPQAAPEPAPPAPEPSPIQAAVPPPQPVTPPPPVRREPPVVRREQRPVRAAVTPHRETRPAPRAEAASRRAAPAGEGAGQRNSQAAAGAASAGGAQASAAAVASYRQRVLAHLARFKVYPDQARERGIVGRAVIAFTLSKAGQVTASSLAGSSGAAILDQATIAMLRRAQPFPAMPDGGPMTMSFTAGIRYDLR